MKSQRMARASLGLALLMGLAGCRYGEMYDQPKIEPYRPSAFFPGEASARPVVAGTVARIEFDGGSGDRVLLTGRLPDNTFTDELPVPLDKALLERGQGRFEIFCAPCHGVDGAGRGPIVLRGFSPPPKLYEPKVAKQPIGYYFDVITNGFGAMYSYAARISVEDRWAIAAYLRALQASQAPVVADLPASDQKALTEAARAIAEESQRAKAEAAATGEAH